MGSLDREFSRGLCSALPYHKLHVKGYYFSVLAVKMKYLILIVTGVVAQLAQTESISCYECQGFDCMDVYGYNPLPEHLIEQCDYCCKTQVEIIVTRGCGKGTPPGATTTDLQSEYNKCTNRGSRTRANLCYCDSDRCNSATLNGVSSMVIVVLLALSRVW